MKREPLRLYGAIRAGFLVLIGGQALVSLLPPVVTGLVLLLSAAVDAGVTEWQRGKVTPLADPRDAEGNPLYTTREVGDITQAIHAQKPKTLLAQGGIIVNPGVAGGGARPDPVEKVVPVKPEKPKRPRPNGGTRRS